jgi:predicted transposase YbfD/YdcC
VKKGIAEYVREQWGVSNCPSVIRLEVEIRREGKTLSFDTRYFISSLDPDEVSASEFQGHILRHWEVENCLHGVKDKE